MPSDPFKKSKLYLLAQDELKTVKKTAFPKDMTLEEFIPAVNPDLVNPKHFAPIMPLLNQAVTSGKVRLLLSAPPRHAKSWTLVHLAALMFVKKPKSRVAYVTYGADLSEGFSRLVREAVGNAGVRLSVDKRGASEWHTAAGGLFVAVGSSGGLTGKGFDLIFVDDPYKERAEAESNIQRNNIYQNFTSVANTRLEPGGSLIVSHTRWNVDDLIGRLQELQKNTGWRYFNFPAVNDDGTTLWPERYDAEYFEAFAKDNVWEFQSMYQGKPRSREGSLFQNVHTYTHLPGDIACDRESIGIDLAYTAKTFSDWSVCITAKKYGDKVYITNVIREQMAVEKFATLIRNEKAVVPNAPIFWFTGGVERGIVDLLRNLNVYVTAEPAKTDKYVRAQAVATAWNRGQILIPEGAEWSNKFTSEVLSFTGVGDRNDDQVDALAAMYEPLRTSGGVRGMGQDRLGSFF